MADQRLPEVRVERDTRVRADAHPAQHACVNQLTGVEGLLQQRHCGRGIALPDDIATHGRTERLGAWRRSRMHAPVRSREKTPALGLLRAVTPPFFNRRSAILCAANPQLCLSKASNCSRVRRERNGARLGSALVGSVLSAFHSNVSMADEDLTGWLAERQHLGFGRRPSTQGDHI